VSQLAGPLVLDRCCFTCPTRGYRLERLAGLGENRQVARRGFIAAYDHIDVQRIEFDASAHTLGLLGGNESRAGAEKWINDDIAAIGEVEERVPPARPLDSIPGPALCAPRRTMDRRRAQACSATDSPLFP
jgi:hypothetical protein